MPCLIPYLSPNLFWVRNCREKNLEVIHNVIPYLIPYLSPFYFGLIIVVGKIGSCNGDLEPSFEIRKILKTFMVEGIINEVNLDKQSLN
jgi:hypothetical protein